MSQGDEFELQGEAITKPEREQGAEGGQKRNGPTPFPWTVEVLGSGYTV